MSPTLKSDFFGSGEGCTSRMKKQSAESFDASYKYQAISLGGPAVIDGF